MASKLNAVKPTSIIIALREIFVHVSLARRRQLGPVLALMLAGAVAELISIGAILPFLALVSNPDAATSSGPLRPLLQAVGLTSPSQVIVAATFAFALSAIVAAAVRLLLVWVSQRFVFGIAQELSVAVYRRTLYQPYTYHSSNNSSETLAAINKVQLVTGGLLAPLMQGFNSAVIAVFILAGLILVDPTVAFAAGFGFAAIYLVVMVATRGIMRRNGSVIAKAQGERLQAAGEGLGGIRDVLLDRSQPVFVSRFSVVEARLRKAQATNNFIAAAPRFIVEGLGVVLIAILAMFLSLRAGGLLGALPVLGALALGAQRLLPLLQLIFTGWSSTMTNGKMLNDLIHILRLPDALQYATPQIADPLPFTDAIALKNVRFAYTGSERPAIDDISLTIPRGSRVGFIGKTGSGKSTLMDLVLGLLAPQSGAILVDGVELTDANRSAWQSQIAHVPQSIYLADATIAENIAFGIPKTEIDRIRLISAAQQAELADVVDAQPNGYDTLVGERGIRLSGGQRQRIGIARALYKQASVLVFDEATSALDNETEQAVMQAINKLDRKLTILIIAHRLSTVEKCDAVFKLLSGSIISPKKPTDTINTSLPK